MNVRLLPASRAIGTVQPGTAVEAIRLMRMPIRADFTGLGLDRAGKQPTCHGIADRVHSVHLHPRADIMRA